MAEFGVIRNAQLEFDGDAFGGQVKTARLAPETTVTSYPVLVPAERKTDVSSPNWTLEIEGLQDWTTATGLAAYLTANHGTVVEVVLTPKLGTGNKKATFEVVCQAVAFGGETDSYADFSVTLGVIGEPSFTAIA